MLAAPFTDPTPGNKETNSTRKPTRYHISCSQTDLRGRGSVVPDSAFGQSFYFLMQRVQWARWSSGYNWGYNTYSTHFATLKSPIPLNCLYWKHLSPHWYPGLSQTLPSNAPQPMTNGLTGPPTPTSSDPPLGPPPISERTSVSQSDSAGGPSNGGTRRWEELQCWKGLKYYRRSVNVRWQGYIMVYPRDLVFNWWYLTTKINTMLVTSANISRLIFIRGS